MPCVVLPYFVLSCLCLSGVLCCLAWSHLVLACPVLSFCRSSFLGGKKGGKRGKGKKGNHGDDSDDDVVDDPIAGAKTVMIATKTERLYVVPSLVLPLSFLLWCIAAGLWFAFCGGLGFVCLVVFHWGDIPISPHFPPTAIALSSGTCPSRDGGR